LTVENIIVGKEDFEINLLYSLTSISTHCPLLKGGNQERGGVELAGSKLKNLNQ